MANQNFDQLNAAQKANAEVMMALMRTSFEGMQRLAELNMAATREFFNATVSNANTLMSAKDLNDLTQVNQSLAKPDFDKVMDYSRKVYDLVAQMQKDMTSVLEHQYSQFSKSATTAIDKTKAANPVAGDIFAATMKSMLEATNKAFDNMNAMSKQMAELADANLSAASSATAKAVGSTGKSKK